MEKDKMNTSYLKFFLMISISMIAMFLLMYTHSYEILEHAWFSETRMFMTLIMGGAMMIIMMSFMFGMYKNIKINWSIIGGGLLLLVLAIFLVRSQITVDDVDYMEGMIPHHSIAILTSERAAIDDVRVRKLSKEIIEAQRREIKEMEWLIKDIRTNGAARNSDEADARPMPEFSNK